jgi:hypothetical protein
MAQLSTLDKALAKDEFVDLYEVLDIPADADTARIRKRINELYIEAQQNLDHRNVKKRLQYQQMFEIYLPQARHLLLDNARRAEYDRYLRAFRSGAPLEPAAPAPPPPRQETTSVEVAAPAVEIDDRDANPAGIAFNFDEPDLDDLHLAPADPTQLAAEREQLWAKWKTGLEHVLTDEDDTSHHEAPHPAPPRPRPVTAASSAAAITTATAPTAARPSSPAATHPVAGTHAASSQGAGAQAAGAQAVSAPVATPAPQPAQKSVQVSAADVWGDATTLNGLTAEEIERRREHRRYALIKTAVQNVGLRWALGSGVGVFLVGCSILFSLDEYYFKIKGYPFGFPRPVGNFISFIGVVMLAGICAWFASGWARRRAVNELSSYSLEELIRHRRNHGGHRQHA